MIILTEDFIFVYSRVPSLLHANKDSHRYRESLQSSFTKSRVCDSKESLVRSIRNHHTYQDIYARGEIA